MFRSSISPPTSSGAIAVPLAALFGADALSYRLTDCGAKVLVTNAAGLAKLAQIEEPLPELELILSSDGADGRAEGLEKALEREARTSPRSTPCATIRR